MLVPQLTAQEALSLLINSNGNLALAAERASVKPAQLLSALCAGMPAAEIQTTFRTLLSINLYQSVLLTSAVYEASLTDLNPGEVAKTYTTLLNLLASISQNQAGPPVNINLQETVLKLLPPEIRQTVVELVNDNPSQSS